MDLSMESVTKELRLEALEMMYSMVDQKLREATVL